MILIDANVLMYAAGADHPAGLEVEGRREPRLGTGEIEPHHAASHELESGFGYLD